MAAAGGAPPNAPPRTMGMPVGKHTVPSTGSNMSNSDGAKPGEGSKFTMYGMVARMFGVNIRCDQCSTDHVEADDQLAVFGVSPQRSDIGQRVNPMRLSCDTPACEPGPISAHLEATDEMLEQESTPMRLGCRLTNDKGGQFFSAQTNQPLIEPPLRTGRVFHLNTHASQQANFNAGTLSLHTNGIAVEFDNARQLPISISWSPFSLVQACRLHSRTLDAARPERRLFKVAVFHYGMAHLFMVDGDNAESERARWVADIACALRNFIVTLFTPFRLSTEPIPGAQWTSHRLLAGYLLMCHSQGVRRIYGELHCHWDNAAAFVAYEDEDCTVRALYIPVHLLTTVSERVGVDCSAFILDSHDFVVRSVAEKALWLRAISNIKVKLRHSSANPGQDELHQYRRAIRESTKKIDAYCNDDGFTHTPLLPVISDYGVPPRSSNAIPTPLDQDRPPTYHATHSMPPTPLDQDIPCHPYQQPPTGGQLSPTGDPYLAEHSTSQHSTSTTWKVVSLGPASRAPTAGASLQAVSPSSRPAPANLPPGNETYRPPASTFGPSAGRDTKFGFSHRPVARDIEVCPETKSLPVIDQKSFDDVKEYNSVSTQDPNSWEFPMGTPRDAAAPWMGSGSRTPRDAAPSPRDAAPWMGSLDAKQAAPGIPELAMPEGTDEAPMLSPEFNRESSSSIDSLAYKAKYKWRNPGNGQPLEGPAVNESVNEVVASLQRIATMDEAVAPQVAGCETQAPTARQFSFSSARECPGSMPRSSGSGIPASVPVIRFPASEPAIPPSIPRARPKAVPDSDRGLLSARTWAGISGSEDLDPYRAPRQQIEQRQLEASPRTQLTRLGAAFSGDDSAFDAPPPPPPRKLAPTSASAGPLTEKSMKSDSSPGLEPDMPVMPPGFGRHPAREDCEAVLSVPLPRACEAVPSANDGLRAMHQMAKPAGMRSPSPGPAPVMNCVAGIFRWYQAPQGAVSGPQRHSGSREAV